MKMLGEVNNSGTFTWPTVCPVRITLTEEEIDNDPILTDVVEAKKGGECGFPLIISEDDMEKDTTLAKAVKERRRETGELGAPYVICHNKVDEETRIQDASFI